MSDGVSKIVFTAEEQVRFIVSGSGQVMSELYRHTMGKISTGGFWAYDGEDGNRTFEFCVSKSNAEELTKWLEEKGATKTSTT